jgi:hypothetical protein
MESWYPAPPGVLHSFAVIYLFRHIFRGHDTEFRFWVSGFRFQGSGSINNGIRYKV